MVIIFKLIIFNINKKINRSISVTWISQESSDSYMEKQNKYLNHTLFSRLKFLPQTVNWFSLTNF